MFQSVKKNSIRLIKQLNNYELLSGQQCNDIPNETNEYTKGCLQLVQQLAVLVIRGLYVEHR
jgi:hypothetical protein